MTKEKAIELLEDLDTEVYNEDSDGYTYHLAIETAVEALKQPEYWSELLVICDNCGHAITVKRENAEPEHKTG